MDRAGSDITDNIAFPVLRRATGGCVATLPMTGLMVIAHRLLPLRHRSPLPPKKIA
jgi:hypothetical protein